MDDDKIAAERAAAAVTIDLSAPQETAKLHLLPCNIMASGPAEVSAYFLPGPAKEVPSEIGGVGQQYKYKYNYQTAHFRGRELTGAKLELPSSALGYVLEEQEDRAGDATDEDAVVTRSWKAVSNFDHVTVWSRDTARDREEAFEDAVTQWTALAAAVHAPVQ